MCIEVIGWLVSTPVQDVNAVLNVCQIRVSLQCFLFVWGAIGFLVGQTIK